MNWKSNNWKTALKNDKIIGRKRLFGFINTTICPEQYLNLLIGRLSLMELAVGINLANTSQKF
jgi:hypothetical protein